MNETAFQEAVGTSKSRWEWLEEKVPVNELRSEHASHPGFFDSTIYAVNDGESVMSRPELDVFGLAMLGGGVVCGTAHVHGTKRNILEYIVAGIRIRLTSERLPMGLTGRCSGR